MSLKVYDFRTDIANVLVTPQIRCRFLKMAVGQYNTGHTHDLGHEIFLVLQGRAEFEVDGQRATLGPGQFCIALTDQYHTVRNVGGEEVIMFLSVTPHVQPTHTFWNDDGAKMPPRFVPAGGYDEPADRATPTAELAGRHTAAAAALAESAAAAGVVQRAESDRYLQAVEAGDEPAAAAARERMWDALSEVFRRTMALGGAWNAFAARTADRPAEPGGGPAGGPGA